MGPGASLRCLSRGIAESVRTVGRRVRKAIQQAPVIRPAVAQMCYELYPSLPVSTQVTSGPVSAPREQVKAMLAWTSWWEELTQGKTGQWGMGGFAAVNLVGPVAGLWC